MKMFKLGQFDKTVTIGIYKIRRSNIITTTYYTYDVWIPGWGGTTITTMDGNRYYKMCTRELPLEIDALPYGPERSAALNAFWEVLDQQAHDLINQAFPETVGKPSDMGEIVMKVEDIAVKQ